MLLEKEEMLLDTAVRFRRFLEYMKTWAVRPLRYERSRPRGRESYPHHPTAPGTVPGTVGITCVRALETQSTRGSMGRVWILAPAFSALVAVWIATTSSW